MDKQITLHKHSTATFCKPDNYNKFRICLRQDGRITKPMLLFITVLLIVVIAFLLPQQAIKNIMIYIPKGSTATDIANILSEKGLVNKYFFLLVSKITLSCRRFKSGTYSLNTNMNIFQLIDILREGRVCSIKITIPEGYTCEQIGQILEENNLSKKIDFITFVHKRKLEGYLFPETYFFSPNASTEQIVDRLVNEFNKRYLPEYDLRAKQLGLNRDQVVILASIIEKEAKLDQERKTIAAVFHNRLRKGWLLESCATVRYALKKFAGKLTYKDLTVKSPYNTYIHYGLPPGPICNPGIKSIEAVLYPEQTDTMFFFSTGERHKFSKYYQEHLVGQKK